MALDPTNMPFSKERQGRDFVGIAAAGGRFDATLRAETMLMEEFNYAGVAAYQAQEDRARFFGLYLTLVGILAAALGAVAQLGGNFNREWLLPIGALLLTLAGLLGIIFFTLLIRLRQAWFNSALAMNTIKEYYIEQLATELPDVHKAFLWRLTSLPRADKRGTPTYIVCYTTAAISSFCLGVAVGIFGMWIGSNGWIQQAPLIANAGITRLWLDILVYSVFAATGIVVFLVSMRLYIRYYRKQLASKKQEQAIERQEQTLAGDD